MAEIAAACAHGCLTDLCLQTHARSGLGAQLKSIKMQGTSPTTSRLITSRGSMLQMVP